MTTPLIILGLLVAPYLVLRLHGSLTGASLDLALATALGLSLVFTFAGVGHFVRTELMSEMLPPEVPYRVWLIYMTGILEFLIAGALLVPRFRRVGGWTAGAVLVLFFPANIYAAFNHVGMGGHLWGPVYLVIRAPLQIILIAWAYWFCARPMHG